MPADDLTTLTPYHLFPIFHCTRYYAIVIRVTPPKHIRDLLRPENAQILATVLNNGRFDPSEISSDTPDNDGLDYTAEQLDSVAHIVGARQLEIETTEANKVDDPEAYIYSVQLLQGLNFDGSIINASSKHMERDRTKWNKALLKKYLKESITRDPAVGSPWMCKERLRLEYEFPLELPEHLKVKSNELRVDLLQRRRKVSFSNFKCRRYSKSADAVEFSFFVWDPLWQL